MRIGIVGLGLIGASVALAARRAWPAARLVGTDRDEVLSHPTVAAVLDHASVDPYDALEADTIVLATPVDVTIEMIQRYASNLRTRSLVLDTGSSKRSILRAASESRLETFVGGHPMTGATHSGPHAARADLFDGRPWFLVGPHSADGALERARRFVEALGAVATAMRDDGSEHDRVMAAVSHLPQVVACALMARVGRTVGEEGLKHAGSGLRDTTRLAASPASVWESVVSTNRDDLKPLLAALADDLQEIANDLDSGDTIRRLFDEANRWKALASSE